MIFLITYEIVIHIKTKLKHVYNKIIEFDLIKRQFVELRWLDKLMNGKNNKTWKKKKCQGCVKNKISPGILKAKLFCNYGLLFGILSETKIFLLATISIMILLFWF